MGSGTFLGLPLQGALLNPVMSGGVSWSAAERNGGVDSRCLLDLRRHKPTRLGVAVGHLIGAVSELFRRQTNAAQRRVTDRMQGGT